MPPAGSLPPHTLTVSEDCIELNKVYARHCGHITPVICTRIASIWPGFLAVSSGWVLYSPCHAPAVQGLQDMEVCIGVRQPSCKCGTTPKVW